MWNVTQFCDDYNITYWVEGKNVSPGWLNIQCPLCDDHSNHGGFNPHESNYHCWRCGAHRIFDVIRALLRVPAEEAERLYYRYRGGVAIPRKMQRHAKTLTLPGDALQLPHVRYLQRRGFDATALVARYGLRGTRSIEVWQDVHCGKRIIIPLYDADGRLISWQGRDITNRAKLRYKGCPLDKAVMNYKHTLYAEHLVCGDTLCVVEGVADVWRMGDGFVCTFGTSITPQQIHRMMRYRRVFFLFDPEDTAQAKARRAAVDLAACGVTVEVLRLLGDNDPAELSAAEAVAIRSEMGLTHV